MNPRLVLISLIAVMALIALVVEEVLRRQPEVQVPLCFARLSEGVRDHDAGQVIAAMHVDYDFTGKWPGLFPDSSKARTEASQKLAQAFFIYRNEKNDLTYTVHSLKPMADGKYEVFVDISVSGRPFDRAVPMLKHHRFILARGSPFTGRYRIVDHDPFDLAIQSGF